MIIIILDEIDQLVAKAGDGILYNLTRLNSDLKQTQISLIGISNDLVFIDNIDPRGIFTSFDTAINAFRKLENTWNWAVQVIVAPWLDVKLESPNKKVFFVTMYFKIDEHELDRQAAKHLQRG